MVRFAIGAIVALAAGVLPAGENDVLYWMIDENAKVWTASNPQMSINDFLATYGGIPDSSVAARIRVTGGNIADDDDVFLDLYVPGEGVVAGSGEYGMTFDNVGGYWGAGVPTGNQSPSGNYSAGSPEYSFIVELGNIDAQDNWTTIATSAAATYSSLGNYIHRTFDMNPSQMAVWTPTSFGAVPEPSSGLLMTIGLAILALRRRRRGL